MASRSSLDAIGDCSGALYKLKENGKEWKQIYAVLRGTDLCYYAGEQDAVLDRRLKDGTKAVLGASPGASELVKAPAPVPVPSYFTIETSHAKKVYCAPTEAACAAGRPHPARRPGAGAAGVDGAAARRRRAEDVARVEQRRDDAAVAAGVEVVEPVLADVEGGVVGRRRGAEGVGDVAVGGAEEVGAAR